MFAGMRGGCKAALTTGNVLMRISADVLPLPYKQGVSSSSLLAPTSAVTFLRTRPRMSAFSALWASIRGLVRRNAPYPPDCLSAPPFS